MQKITVFACAMLFALVCGCAPQSPEKAASRGYVKAAQKVVEASRAFNNADYAKSLELCVQARKDVEKIVEDYPETTVVLKVVTDSNTLIGPCRFVDMCDKIIPKLEGYVDKDMKPIELAWIIAVSKKKSSERDAALSTIVTSLTSPNSAFGLKIENSEKIANACVLKIHSAELRSELKSKISSSAEEKPAVEIPTVSASQDSKPVEKIEDETAFIAQAKSDASLVIYELRAVDNLRKKALVVRNASPEVKRQFSEILSSAYENILKITLAKMRENALANISIAFANMGEDARAINIASKLDTPENFSVAFQAIAEKASKGKHYVEAIALANRIPEPAQKDKFLSELSIGVASQGLFKESREIAKLVKDVSLRNKAYANNAKAAYEKNDKASAIAAVEQIDVSELSCLDVFGKGKYEIGAMSGTMRRGIQLANLAEKVIPENAGLGEALNNLAILQSQTNVASPKDFSVLAGKISTNLIALSKSSEAIDFISKNVHNSDTDSTLNNIFKIAVLVAPNDKELARKALMLASNICEGSGISSQIGLALAVQSSGLSKKESSEILTPFLPSFKD